MIYKNVVNKGFHMHSGKKSTTENKKRSSMFKIYMLTTLNAALNKRF